MKFSSDTNQPILTDLEQYDADQAQNMLDAIIGFQDSRAAHMRSGLKALQLRGADISDKAVADAMATLDDIFSDLFGSVWPDLANKAMTWDKRPSVSVEKSA